MEYCKNCNHKFKGNFCNHCGQSKNVKRSTLRQFIVEAFFSFFDLENGLYKSVIKLSKYPGHSIKSYVLGQRLSLYPPVKYLLLVGALSTLVALHFQLFTGSILELLEKLHYSQTPLFIHYAEEYTTLINIVTIPIFAAFSYFFLSGKNYNYAENLIINIYITAHQLFFLLVFIPFYYHPSSQLFVINYLYPLLTLAYNYVVFLQIFNLSGWKSKIKVIGIILISYLAQLIFNLSTFEILHKFSLI